MDEFGDCHKPCSRMHNRFCGLGGSVAQPANLWRRMICAHRIPSEAELRAQIHSDADTDAARARSYELAAAIAARRTTPHWHGHRQTDKTQSMLMFERVDGDDGEYGLPCIMGGPAHEKKRSILRRRLVAAASLHACGITRYPTRGGSGLGQITHGGDLL